jgi:L-2,4-diaminobutyrate decarboxylase
LGIIAYTALKYYGNGYYRQYIDSRYDLAGSFASMIRSDKNLQIAVEPESNIVCFRFAPNRVDDITLNNINAEIRSRIVKEGSFYIVQAELSGKIWLRLTIINPVTTKDDLIVLIKRIKEIGKEAFQN